MKKEKATVAGGCFWGMEDLFRHLPGVLQTDVGYMGGSVPDATYEQVKKGTTGHAEALEIIFDADQLPYKDLLLYFFKIHDPTTHDQQGNDIGSQYRSAIFYHTPEQQEIARKVLHHVESSGAWAHPLATHLSPAGPFYRAEEYHQDYLLKNPNGYTCHFERQVIWPPLDF